MECAKRGFTPLATSRSVLIVTKQKGRKRPSGQKDRQNGHFSQKSAQQPFWLWGNHAVRAALDNPARKVTRVIATQNAVKRMGLTQAEDASPNDLDKLLPSGAVHQGIAAYVEPLSTLGLQDIIAKKPARIAVLDQVSDPHNLGAVLRSAAAFGVGAIVLQTRHAPGITGVAAKTAAGAAEVVQECRVVNIARALDELGKAGYCTIGLAGEVREELADMIPVNTPIALVFGAEGAGLRPAVAKACTWRARIPMTPLMESLNISNAAAIAFYEAARTRVK